MSWPCLRHRAAETQWEPVEGKGWDEQAAGAGGSDAAASDAAPVSGRRVAALARAGMRRKAQGMGWV